jgi:transposase-like protein
MTTASFMPGSLSGSSPMLTASGRTMGKSDRSNGRIVPCDGRTLGERVASYLRAKHPEKTAIYVASEIGVSAETVRKWLEQGSVPNGAAMLALIRRYRMSFVDRVLGESADAWIAELARQEEQERLEGEASAIRRKLALVMGGRP